jgi:hypothetical protein
MKYEMEQASRQDQFMMTAMVTLGKMFAQAVSRKNIDFEVLEVPELNKNKNKKRKAIDLTGSNLESSDSSSSSASKDFSSINSAEKNKNKKAKNKNKKKKKNDNTHKEKTTSIISGKRVAEFRNSSN